MNEGQANNDIMSIDDQDSMSGASVMMELSSTTQASDDLCRAPKRHRNETSPLLAGTSSSTAVSNDDVAMDGLKQQARRRHTSQENQSPSDDQSSLDDSSDEVYSSDDSSDESHSSDDSSDEMFEPPKRVRSSEVAEKSYNTMPISDIVEFADRYRVKSTATAAIVNATVTDLMRAGYIDPKGRQTPTSVPSHLLFDPARIENHRKSAREECNQQFFDSKPVIKGFFVDGKTEKEATILEDGQRKPKKAEFLTMVSEPCGQYLGCVPIQNKKAATQCDAVFNFFEDNEIATDDIVLMGTDGENANTGAEGGFTRYVEEKLGRAIFHVICMLHLLELLMKYAFNWANGDGASKSSDNYTGPIGGRLANVVQEPIVSFETMPCPTLLNDLPEQTSTDQQYLAQAAKVIVTGKVPKGFEKKNIGKLSASRWCTLASRVLRLYMSIMHPSDKLKWLVRFILEVKTTKRKLKRNSEAQKQRNLLIISCSLI